MIDKKESESKENAEKTFKSEKGKKESESNLGGCSQGDRQEGG